MNDETRETMFSHDRNFWETPPSLFAMLDAEFHFDVDVGAHQQNALLDRWIGPHIDALDDETCWGEPGETVYSNPPYGRTIGDWIRKALAEQARGVTTVMLLPARTDTQWFHDLVCGHAEVRFLRGRLKFRIKGEELHPAPFPSMVCIFRAAPSDRGRS